RRNRRRRVRDPRQPHALRREQARRLRRRLRLNGIAASTCFPDCQISQLGFKLVQFAPRPPSARLKFSVATTDRVILCGLQKPYVAIPVRSIGDAIQPRNRQEPVVGTTPHINRNRRTPSCSKSIYEERRSIDTQHFSSANGSLAAKKAVLSRVSRVRDKHYRRAVCDIDREIGCVPRVRLLSNDPRNHP